jgi:hypothetical protein
MNASIKAEVRIGASSIYPATVYRKVSSDSK